MPDANSVIVGQPLSVPVGRPLRTTLHDSEKVANAQTAKNSYFTSKVFNDNSAKVNPFDTNMDNPGALVQGTTFDAFGVQFTVQKTTTKLADYVNLLDNGYLRFNLSRTERLGTRLDRIPSGTGIAGFADAATTVAATTVNDLAFSNGIQSINEHFSLMPDGRTPLRITSLEAFFVTIEWSVALTLSATLKTFVFLQGVFYTTL